MPQQEAENVTLINLGNGVAVEWFDAELKKVMENIRDVNTDGRKARRITLTVDFLPLPDRTGMTSSVAVASRLASVPPAPTGTMFILKEAGELHAVSHDTRQEVLFDRNVVPMHGSK